jgi:hypothetical protein
MVQNTTRRRHMMRNLMTFRIDRGSLLCLGEEIRNTSRPGDRRALATKGGAISAIESSEPTRYIYSGT